MQFSNPPTEYASLGRLGKIAAPIVVTYLSEMALALTDIVMVGHLGSVEMAAVGLAAGIFFTLIFAGSGILSVVGVFVPDALAKHEHSRVGVVVKHAVLIAMPISGLLFISAHLLPTMLAWSGQDPRVVAHAASYLKTVSWASLPLLVFTVLRGYISSVSTTQIVLTINFAAILLNAALDYAFIFGKLGAPEFGVAGPGIATAIVSLGMCVALYVCARRIGRARGHDLRLRTFTIDAPLLRRMLILGTPIAGIGIVESGMFSAISLLAGRYGADFLAANQIAISLSDVGIALAFGIGEAATICVAHNYGARSAAGTRLAGWRAIACGAVVMLGFGLLIIAARDPIISLFLGSDAAHIRQAALQLLGITALFQLVDGSQAVMSRVLRGLHDTLYPMWVSVIAYWGFGVCGGQAIASLTGIGGPGLWVGMAAGLAIAALVFLVRFIRFCGRMAGTTPASSFA